MHRSYPDVSSPSVPRRGIAGLLPGSVRLLLRNGRPGKPLVAGGGSRRAGLDAGPPGRGIMTGDRGIRRLTAAAVLLVAVIAAWVSFIHIQNPAVTHGQNELSARLPPRQ